MARNIDLDLSSLKKFVRAAPEAVFAGAQVGVKKVMSEWRADARDVAPLKRGGLRKSINVRTTGNNLDNLTGTIRANAIERNGGGRFNYGFWLHDGPGQNSQLHTAGTVHKFLEQPAQQNQNRYKTMLEAEIQAELARRGLS